MTHLHVWYYLVFILFICSGFVFVSRLWVIYRLVPPITYVEGAVGRK